MSYSDKAAAVTAMSQQLISRADHPTKLRALLDMIGRMDLGAEVTDDSGGTMIYIPKTR